MKKAWCGLILVLSSACFYLVYMGSVPLRHIVFSVITTVYAVCCNAYIRGANAPPVQPRSISPVPNAVRLLFPFTLLFSLLVPFYLLVVSTGASDRSHLRNILAPHLFLVMLQILLETVGFLLANVFTIYVRLGVTTAFLCYRIPVLFTWYEQATAWATSKDAATYAPYIPVITQVAPVLNIIFWSFALLCFHLLYCLPAVISDPHPGNMNKPSAIHHQQSTSRKSSQLPRCESPTLSSS